MTDAERAYYDRRAPEYDDWYQGSGLYASRSRPGWHQEVEAIRKVVRSLDAASLLDVAVGTAFLTREFPKPVTAIDQSPQMLNIARERLPGSSLVRGDALLLPFIDHSFDVLFAGHFYGHLDPADRNRFLSEARRVAKRLLIIDAALRPDVPTDEQQQRTLNDGSTHTVFKRYFTPGQLASELNEATVLHAGAWFLAVISDLAC